MLYGNAVKPLLRNGTIRSRLKLLVLQHPPSFVTIGARSFYCSCLRELSKQVDDKSRSSFDKIVQDLDARLSKNGIRGPGDKSSGFEQVPRSSDGWLKRSRRRIIFLGVGLLAFGLAEYCLLFWHAKPVVGEADTSIVSIGRPQIGAPWKLINSKGEPEGSENLKGNWLLIYFGFTHCPDVCPDELEKMIRIVDELDADKAIKFSVVPVFISVDPERDTPERVREYCSEFSPKLKGYTGTPEQVAKVAKDFRVYYKAGPRMSKNSNDYIVDHSVMVYLMDPEGNFAEFYGQNRDEKEVVKMINSKAKEYNARKRSKLF